MQFETTPLPEKMYKYTKVDQNFYDLLINPKLWFSNPKDFNDPFDNNIRLQEDLNEKELRLLAQGKDFIEKSKFDEETLVAYFKKNPHKLNDIYEPLKQLISNVGICCFSENYDNLLLWAHYANCHKGVSLEFDVKTMQEWFKEIKRVNYQESMPDINILEVYKEEILSSLPFYKSNHWSYEREIRIWIKNSGLISFPMHAITGIAFGLKMTEDQITAICRLMVRLGYTNVNYVQAELHPTDYKLNFIDVNIIDAP
ncbi:hypothetical protein BDD43_3110 [Mucilaginibacter gracilis]|uniref:DUF2971 family protein n=1 Tax=Mucilaginibacter gracilis TaxID=423350 RepID=A0A495J1W2_9SPHI|nr:DUF2971 domain-containing protein [Mucilaginibacter gracilis]RKR82917.1 hypothetical protein BDD43_3110 [Mucilaginibacter gracilis]